MKRIVMISIFIFLTGLFSGLFFSTGLSSDNHAHLSSMLMSGLSPSSDFIKGFMRSLLWNLAPAALMLPALFTRLLSPLPVVILLCRSFAVGFCSGLIQTAAPDNALLVSLLKFFPQNLFFIPSFIILASVIFYCSVTGTIQKNRPSREKKGLKNTFILSLVLILAGCIIQEACHLIAL